LRARGEFVTWIRAYLEIGAGLRGSRDPVSAEALNPASNGIPAIPRVEPIAASWV
jgi:hypothetical protein